MKHRALIIEDDVDIAESVTETLESLGHENVWVKSQEEARQQIADGGFTYVLLDLQIPVRFGRGLACIEYGEHLAREMYQSPTMHGVPIIVMTAYGKEGLEIAAPLCEHGVVDFINKPFPRTGRTLASLIQSVLDRVYRMHERASHGRPAKPFQAGELVFYDDRVELCGIKICGEPECGVMRSILETLRERRPDGHYKAFSGTELARRAGADRGQNAAAEAIRGFRLKIQQLLLDELSIECGPCDVIENDRRHGYRFSSKIEARGHDEPASRAARSDRDPVTPDGPVFRLETRDRGPETAERGPVKQRGPVIGRATGPDGTESGPDGTANGGDGTANHQDGADVRRRWVCEQLRARQQLRREDLELQFGVSARTAKRDFQALRDAGEVEFVGPAKTGHYCLTPQRR